MADDTEKISHAAAVVELKRGLLAYRAFEHASQVIQILADHDKTLAELEHRIATARKNFDTDMARYQKELATASATVEKAKADAAAAADADRKAGRDLIAEAKIEAEGIVDYAKRKLSTAETAAADADSRRQQYEAAVASRKEELADLNTRIKSARAHVQKIMEA